MIPGLSLETLNLDRLITIDVAWCPRCDTRALGIDGKRISECRCEVSPERYEQGGVSLCRQVRLDTLLRAAGVV
jgi:hypothetical protein